MFLSEPTYDPVFASFGMKTLTNDYINELRTYNMSLKRGTPITHFLPQAGFQEQVCMNDAGVLIIGGQRGGGKAESVDSKVFTPFGYRRFGDIKEGDIISDPISGGMQKIIRIFEHPNKDLWKIKFSDDTSVECCDDHLWNIRVTNYTPKRRHYNNTNIDDEWRVWTTSQIRTFIDKQAESPALQKNNLLIPLCNPIKITKSGNSMRKTDIDPYIIGAILGDGCITDSARKSYTATFTSADNDIVQQFIKEGIDMSVINSNSLNRTAKDYLIKNDRLEQSILLCKINGCNSLTKFIPTCYKYGTIEERFAIIQGLMDTDGYIDDRGHCFYNTVSSRLAEDFQFVIESLGGTASISKKKAGYVKDGEFNQCNDNYELYIRIPDTKRLFRLQRKIDRCVAFNGGLSERTRRIVGYEYAGKKDARCILVSAPHSLYCTDHFIVTHNTYIITLAPLRYIYHPRFVGIGYRKQYDDIMDGPWKESLALYSSLAIPKESSYKWTFKSGADIHYDQLQNEEEIEDRVRGIQYPYILIDEVPQIKAKTFFTLLASNRNALGLRNQFIGTCNPQREDHWLYKFIEWYIDKDTGLIREDRNGKKRYFFKFGEDIDEIFWGNSKEEVYHKAKDKIESVITDGMRAAGLDWRSMITSVCFIEGKYEQNTLFIKNDPDYYGRLAQQGGLQVLLDMQGRWGGIKVGNADISVEDFNLLYSSPEQRNGVMSMILDVALSGDDCTFGIFDGYHLVDIEAFSNVGSIDVVNHTRRLLKKYHIREENFAFDSQGVGQFLKQPFNAGKPHGAIAFSGNSASTDPGVYRNLKSQCIEQMLRAIREGRRSIDPYAAEKLLPDGTSLKEHLGIQRQVLIRIPDAPKVQYISKPEMRKILGKKSPDEMDMLYMHELLGIMGKLRSANSGIEGIGYLSYLS